MFFSSWRNQKKQVVSGFKTTFCRLDRLIHSSFKLIIHYPIAKSRLVSGFKTPLCTHAFWKTKLLKNQISVCLWVWILLFRAHFWLSLGTNVCPRFYCGCFFTTFYLQMLDIINVTTKDKNITVSSLWNRILKIWGTLFELMQIETQWKKNYFIFFCNVQLELWKGTLTWNKKIHAQNQQKIF